MDNRESDSIRKTPQIVELLEGLDDSRINDESANCCSVFSTYSASSCYPGKDKYGPKLVLPTTLGMQHARAWSLKLIIANHSSLFSSCGVDDILYLLLSLCTALIISGFAIPSFIMGADDDNIRPLEIVRLSFAVLAFLLITVELSYKAWMAVTKRRFNEENYNVSTSPTLDSKNDEPSGKKVTNWWRNTTLYVLMKPYLEDIIRLQVAEFIMYVTVVCNIIKHASGQSNSPYNPTGLQIVELTGLVFSIILFILHAFVMQFYVIVKGIRSLERLRRMKFAKPSPSSNDSRSKCCYCIRKHFDLFDQKWNSKKHAVQSVLLEVYYIFHIICQMVIQVCVLANLGFKFQCENDSELSTGYVSPFTWAMLVLGFLIPNRIFGSIIFYVSTYVWTKRFPVVLVLNILDVFTKSEQCNVHTKEKALKILDSINGQVMECKQHPCWELAYPILSPLLSISSCFHFLILLSFPILTIMGSTDPQLNNCSDYYGCYITCNLNFAWFVYFCIAGGIAWISNYGAVTAAVWWMIIVPSAIITILLGVIGTFAILVMGSVFCCVLIVVLLGICSDSNNRARHL